MQSAHAQPSRRIGSSRRTVSQVVHTHRSRVSPGGTARVTPAPHSLQNAGSNMRQPACAC